MELTDTSPMPFGKYEKVQMANVPDVELLTIWETYSHNFGKSIKSGALFNVLTYIKDFGPHNLKR